MPVLSKADLAFFDENGYVVAKGVISKEQAALTAKRVWTYANQDSEDPATWGGGIMVEMYHAQEQWDNRQAPLIHEAFAQVWGQEELRVSRDRVSINPPAKDKEAAKDRQTAFGLHFDTAFAQLEVAKAKKQRPIAKGTQGVLYLVDTPEENGAFVRTPANPTLRHFMSSAGGGPSCRRARRSAPLLPPPQGVDLFGAFVLNCGSLQICVPGMHNQVDEWLDTLPDDVRPNQMLQMKGEDEAQAVLLGARTKRVAAEAGDLVIWDTRLPHSAASNIGDAPRVAQYITMNPATPLTAEDIASNTQWWSERHAGFGKPKNRVRTTRTSTFSHRHVLPGRSD